MSAKLIPKPGEQLVSGWLGSVEERVKQLHSDLEHRHSGSEHEVSSLQRGLIAAKGKLIEDAGMDIAEILRESAPDAIEFIKNLETIENRFSKNYVVSESQYTLVPMIQTLIYIGIMHNTAIGYCLTDLGIDVAKALGIIKEKEVKLVK